MEYKNFTQEEIEEALKIMSVDEINLTFHESKDCFNRAILESNRANRLLFFALIVMVFSTIFDIFYYFYFFNKDPICRLILFPIFCSFIVYYFYKILKLFDLSPYSIVGSTFYFSIEYCNSHKGSLLKRTLDYQEITNNVIDRNKVVYSSIKKYIWRTLMLVFYFTTIRAFILLMTEYFK